MSELIKPTLRPRVSNAGFAMPTREEVLTELTELAQSQGINIVPGSNDHLIANFLSSIFYGLYEEIASIKAGTSVKEATGQELDNLAVFKSINRIQRASSLVDVTLTFKKELAQKTYAAGALKLSTKDGKFFTNIEAFTIEKPTDKEVTKIVGFKSVETGREQNVLPGAISVIDGDDDLKQVENRFNAYGGADAESDQELRARILNTYPSALSLVRLEQELTKIGLRNVRIIHNASSAELDGLPPGKTAIVIDDGSSTSEFDDDIAKRMWEVIRANSSISEDWYFGDDNDKMEKEPSILEYEYNGIPVKYPVLKPVDLQVEFQINIESRIPSRDTLKAESEAVIYQFIRQAKIGAPLATGGLLAQLIQIEDYRTASAINIKVKKATDTSWGDFLELKYYEIPKIADKGMTINYTYNGKTQQLQNQPQNQSQDQSQDQGTTA